MAYLKNDFGVIDITSRSLYVKMHFSELPEAYRWMKNKYLIKSKSSNNEIIRNIIESVEIPQKYIGDLAVSYKYV